MGAFLHATVSWGKAVKGGLPVGFQNGLAVLAVTATESAPPGAIDEATRRPDKRWSVFPLPVLVDVPRGQAYAPSGLMMWGALYQGYLGEQQDLVVAGTGATTLRSTASGSRRLSVGLVVGVAIVAAAVVMALFSIVT